MACYSDEIFGPVLSVVRVDSYDEGLELINDNPYGNGMAIFTRDGGAARQFQWDVNVGMVGVNVPIPVPVSYYSFGGWKASLFGDTHMYGPEGINFYTRGKVVTSRWPDPHTSTVDLGFPRTGSGRDRAGRRPAAPAEGAGRAACVAGERGDGPRAGAADDAAVGARRRSGQAGGGVRVLATCGRSTATSCGRSRTSSTARSSPRRATSSSVRWSPTRPPVTGRSRRALFATLNEMYGNRTVCGIGRGDSAVRVTNGKPTTIDTLRESVHVIRELANGRSVDYKGSTITFPWAGRSRLEVWVAGYGPRALALAGEVGDGFILQLADPQIVAWTIAAVREGAERAGRDPDAVTICVAAPAYVGDDVAHMRDQCRWFGGMVGNHVADIVGALRRLVRGARPRSPSTSRAARATTTTSTVRPATCTRQFVPDEIVDRFCILGPVDEHVRRLNELRDARRRPVRHLPPARRQGRHAAGLRRARDPADSPSTVAAKT